MLLEERFAEFARTLDRGQLAALSELLDEITAQVDDGVAGGEPGEDVEGYSQEIRQKHGELVQTFNNIMKTWDDAVKAIIDNMK